MSNSIEWKPSNLRPAQRFLLSVLLGILIAAGNVFADANLSDCNRDSLLAALQNGGTVTLSSTNSCTYHFQTTVIIQTNVTVIVGTNTIRFRGSGVGSVFRVSSNVSNFKLIGATISNGTNTMGGALFIEPGATVTLSNCVFTSNAASGTNGTSGADGATNPNIGGNGGNGTAGKDGFGGAIFNNGTLTALFCRFATNNARGGNGGNGGSGETQGGDGGNGGGGASGFGGAIFNLGSLHLRDCTFERNAALGGAGGKGGAAGGGVFSGLVGNGRSGGEGSGGAIYSTNSTGKVSLLNSTFSFNRAQSGNSAAAGNDSNGNGNDGPRGKDSFGGAFFNSGQNAGAFFNGLTNSTFFENTAQGGNGGNGGPGNFTGGDAGDGGNGTGGSFYNSTSGSNWIVHCTFSQGAARGGTNGLAGGAAFPGSNGSNGASRGGNVANAGTFNRFNLLYSLIASNVSGGNGYGSFSDRGTNLSTDASMTLTNGSVTKTNARIGSLADNGGLTKTVALLSGSPAIDKISETNCIIAFDQRGFPRPYANGCDIGAVERSVTFSIQGQVAENNVGISNITLTIGDQTAITGTNGFYIISDLQTNSYTVTPQPAGFFSPPNQFVRVPPDATGINFTNFGARSAIARTNGQLRISFLALPNRTYRIQAATNLVSTNFMDGTNLISSNLTIWTTISTNTSSSSGVFQIIETSVTNFQRRFFRTIRP